MKVGTITTGMPTVWQAGDQNPIKISPTEVHNFNIVKEGFLYEVDHYRTNDSLEDVENLTGISQK